MANPFSFGNKTKHNSTGFFLAKYKLDQVELLLTETNVHAESLRTPLGDIMANYLIV